ncbi:hypothetical protein SAMN05216554_4148 [Herbiconiux ginsengi]|uniref:Uncharacterized protein n=1 Tax=Herbiconiux ginsengi TaxID=381665 RepID=A0A1H3TEZ1_9MICO|nr:hypothetical protein SAMN05216554_4148 [Herbiconiux ginsengi]
MTQSGTGVNVSLSAAAQNDLALASAQAVVDTYAKLDRYFRKDRWLGAQNSYRRDTVMAIKNDVTNGGVNQKHLAEYIAASAPLHASDGWSFLGRAMQSHLAGDTGAARHLAYYAELRAAMSILAAHGVGVFDKQHFVVTSPTSVTKVSGAGATHTFTWQALQWWSTKPGSWSLVGDVIRPYGRNLSEWLGAAPKYSGWGPIATSWIESLGLDIQRVANDQFSRNEASYRPNRVVEPDLVDTSASARFAINLWRALEPGPNGFPNLDLHLLRVTFERAFEAVEGAGPTARPGPFAAAANAIAKVAGVGQTSSRTANFLMRSQQPLDLDILRNAAQDSASSDRSHHMHVMSRAALLLVLATTASRRLIEDAGSGLDDTSFWWEALGVERGIWRTAPATNDLRDFWEDISDELDVVEDWLDRDVGNYTSLDLAAACPRIFSRLAQFELPGLWGMSA